MLLKRSCGVRLNNSLQQALWGALALGREKEGGLTTTSLEFEYLHRKSLCKNADWRM